MRTTIFILAIAAILGLGLGALYEAMTDAPRGVMDGGLR
jgi:hypothetical protein